MGQPKKKLTAAQKAAKKQRQQEFMTIFINGKQKRVRRPVTIDGMDVEDYIRQNADPIWLQQNEMWEDIELIEYDLVTEREPSPRLYEAIDPDDGEIPF
jgi:16S rRNA U516 pseudouridylate synthase RsuA-like enzyme